jgi:hypothetical protein
VITELVVQNEYLSVCVSYVCISLRVYLRARVFARACVPGLLNDLHSFDTATRVWAQLNATGDPPPPCMCAYTRPRTMHAHACMGKHNLLVYIKGRRSEHPRRAGLEVRRVVWQVRRRRIHAGTRSKRMHFYTFSCSRFPHQAAI